MNFSEIRKISVDSIAADGEGCSVVSSLNWLRYEKQIMEIIKYIPENSKVLEIGCGRGMTVAMIKNLVPTADVTGMDIQKFPSWDGYEKYGVKYFIGDATKLPFDDREFDVVLSFGVVEHVASDCKFVRENLRVLKDGGKGFILNIPNKHSINEFIAKKLGIWSHEIKYRKVELEHLIKSYGIEKFTIKRRFLIPAQVCRVSTRLGDMFNKISTELDGLDRLLCMSPLSVFSQVFDVSYQKNK